MKIIDLAKSDFLSEIYNSLSVSSLAAIYEATGDSFVVNNGKVTEVLIHEAEALQALRLHYL